MAAVYLHRKESDNPIYYVGIGKEQFKSNIYPCVTIEGKSLHKKINSNE